MKIAFFGSAGSGKTNFIRNILINSGEQLDPLIWNDDDEGEHTRQGFDPRYIPTDTIVEHQVGEDTLYDIGGSDVYDKAYKDAVVGADIKVFCYDTSSRQSLAYLNHMTGWFTGDESPLMFRLKSELPSKHGIISKGFPISVRNGYSPVVTINSIKELATRGTA